MQAKAGDVIEFRGCTFDADWEFDKPAILYYPVQKYGFNSIEHLVENVCIDLLVYGYTEDKFGQSDLEEFQWRGWNPKGFAKRKNAVHKVVKVEFYIDNNELTFRYL